MVLRSRWWLRILWNLKRSKHISQGRPTLKDVEHFRQGSVREIYERSWQFTSEPSRVNLLSWTMLWLLYQMNYLSKIMLYQISYLLLAYVEIVVWVNVIENPADCRFEFWSLSIKSRKLKEFVFKRICASIPKSSKLYCYVKVRKLIKHECSTKIMSLNKITQHGKKLLFNCSGRVYQGLMKLKFRANRYLSLFTCNSLMYRYKNQTHISIFYQFKLSTDTGKNPGPTPMYIDPSKTISAPYSQGNELIFGQNSGQQCVAMSFTWYRANKSGVK